jgi:hypothetical protein
MRRAAHPTVFTNENNLRNNNVQLNVWHTGQANTIFPPMVLHWVKPLACLYQASGFPNLWMIWTALLMAAKPATESLL